MGVSTKSKADMSETQAIPGGIANQLGKYGLQIGIVVVALAIWLFFVIGAPRTFLSFPIYAAYMSTTPFFA